MKLGELRRQRSLKEQWPLILGASFFGLKNLTIFKCVFKYVEPLELSMVRYPKPKHCPNFGNVNYKFGVAE